ncbi:MAG: glycerophosphodiester phosphodiesterase [Sneathiella sp.]|nr:glycerophosphodiester phosphodiesterase [Sneathiella sp.]
MATRLTSYLDTAGPIAMAHRGASLLEPENTMAAFEAAVRLGYRYIETDVRLTRDGRLITFHDDRLDRVTNLKGVIARMDWLEIRKARVLGREPIPEFAELLRSWPDLRFNIDPKSDAAVGPLIQLLKDMNAEERVCIGSFSTSRLREIHNASKGNICLAMGPLEVAKLRFASRIPGPGFFASRLHAACVQVPPSYRGIRVIDQAFVSKAHERGLRVHAWTINERTEIERLLDLGVDGIMSDDAVLLKSIFMERNHWPE